MKSRALLFTSIGIILCLVVIGLAPRNAAEAQTSVGTTTRVSVDSSGAEGDEDSFFSAISADGRFVVFHSDASNLVPGDTNRYRDIFVHDRQTGATIRVSVDSSGAQGNARSNNPTISADSRFVAFQSYASNLVPGDTNGHSDVFVYDRQTGATTRVSVDSSGAQGDEYSYNPAISADGRFVAFRSLASNLVPGDTNGFPGIFVHDRQTGATTRVSIDSSGGYQNHTPGLPAISADGRFVAFESLASNLVPEDTNDDTDIFVHDRQTGATTRVSVDSSGAQVEAVSGYPAISPDGRFVAFESLASNLVPGDTNPFSDIYVHDRQTGATTRVSVDSSGGQSFDNSNNPSISADGRFVAFSSNASNLVEGDTNDTEDIFVHDRQTGATTRVSVDSSGAQQNDRTGWPDISADGRFVAFHSNASNLVQGDTNGYYDVFVHDLEGSVLGGNIVRLGFDPTTDGFNFSNFGATYDSDFPLEDTRLLFEGAERCPFGHCYIRPRIQLWYRWVSRNVESFPVCLGMASTSLLLFEGLGPDDRNEPADFQTNASVTNDILQGNGGSLIRRYIALNQIRQKLPPVSWALDDSRWSTLSENLEKIIDGMEPDGTPMVLSLTNREESAAHALLPIEVEDKGNGLYAVTVYNANIPSDTNTITIDTNAGTWRIYWTSTVFWEGNEASHTLSVIPITDFTQKSGLIIPPSNSPQLRTTENQRIQVSSYDVGELLIIDSFGRRLGYLDQSFINEIPDADAFWPDSAFGQSSEPVYQLPYGFEYTLKIDGRSIDEPSIGGLLILLPELFFSVDNIAVESGTRDEVIFGTDNYFTYKSNQAKAIDVSLAAEPDSVNGQLFTLSGVDLSGSDETRFVYDANDNAIKLEQGHAAPTNHDVEYYFQDEAGEHSFSHASVPTTAGSSQIYDVDAADESGAIICTDEDRDGATDTCQNIENQAPPLLNEGVTMLASAASDGTSGNSDSWQSVVSADGRYVAFTSYSTNLVPGDTSSRLDIFVRDLETGYVERVSVSSNEEEANDASIDPAISGDGRFVIFGSHATNLVPDDTNGVSDLFVRDRVTGETRRVSVGSGGLQSDTYTYEGVISDNGRFVIFQSFSALTPNAPNGGWFLRDLHTNQTTLFTTDNIGAPSLSADGTKIAFEYADWDLYPGGGYLFNHIFVQDPNTGVREVVSVSTNGALANDTSRNPVLSPDGRYIVFESMADNLVTGDTNEVIDIFLHDLEKGTTRLVSRTEGGLQANGNSYTPDVSRNGRYIVFTSTSDNLATNDTNNKPDIFIYDTITARVALISGTVNGVPGSGRSENPTISDDGRITTFDSSSVDLVPQGASGVFVRMPAPPSSTYSIVGAITDSSGQPIANVIITDNYGNSTITDNSGNFQLNSLSIGSYRLTPMKEGYNFTPPSLLVWLPPSGSNVDFIGLTSNDSPNAPTSPTPENNATSIPVNSGISWSATDPDNDPLTYEIRFGTTTPPPQVVASQSATTYDPPGNLAHSTTYYWQIVASDGRGGSTPGPVWQFTTAAAPPAFPDVFYVSPATNGTFSGIAYTGSDILQYTKSTNTWAMFFDGSDVGVTKNVSAFAFLSNGDILLSFVANQPISGLGTFAAHDVARFDPTTTGTNTAGSFAWYFDGSDVGLTTTGEKIDALDALADGRLLISVTGAGAVPKPGGGTIKWQDEDVAAFTLSGPGATTTGTWAAAPFFDGTAVTGLGAEDVSGFALDEPTGDRYLTIVGAFNLGSLRGNGKSIVKLPAGSNTPVLIPWTVPPFNVDGLELIR